jgi:tRNA-dihydrouridine synthase A
MHQHATPPITISHRFSIAPMLHWTDTYCRYFFRQLSQHSLLYTDMITTGALLHQDPARFLDYQPEEHPLALQLGGSDPVALAHCAKLADTWGYDEINLNVGCPSNRVQAGRFGACLMAEPELVADCVAAMREVTAIPITVKHRIGIDHQDSYDELQQFVATIAQAGCKTFIVHARKAWLKGLSPKQNREIPPLRYDWVYRLKKDFLPLNIILNGGIQTITEAKTQLEQVDGVMVGRAAYQNPWLLSEVDQTVWKANSRQTTRQHIVLQMMPFITKQMAQGIALKQITRHMLGLFQGQPGAKAWRRHLTEQGCRSGADIQVVEQALSFVT